MVAVQVVAVLSLKGGVGKTTVALGLAGAAQAHGVRTLVVDLDPQANATVALDAGADHRHRRRRARRARPRPWCAARSRPAAGARAWTCWSARSRPSGTTTRTRAAAQLRPRSRRRAWTGSATPDRPTGRTRRALPAGDRRLPAVAGPAHPQRAGRRPPGRAGHRPDDVRRVRRAARLRRGADRAGARQPRPAAARACSSTGCARATPSTSSGSPSCASCSGRWCSAACCPTARPIQQAQGACLPIQRWDTPGAREVSAVFTVLLGRVLRSPDADRAAAADRVHAATGRAATQRSGSTERSRTPTNCSACRSRSSASRRLDQPGDARLGRRPGVGAGGEERRPLPQLRRDLGQQLPDVARGTPARLGPGADRQHRGRRPQGREVGRRVAQQRIRLPVRLGQTVGRLPQQPERPPRTVGAGTRGRPPPAPASVGSTAHRSVVTVIAILRPHSATRTRSHTPGPARIRSTNSRAGASGSSAECATHPPAPHPVATDRHRRRERPRRLLDPPLAHVGDRGSASPRRIGRRWNSTGSPSCQRTWIGRRLTAPPNMPVEAALTSYPPSDRPRAGAPGGGALPPPRHRTPRSNTCSIGFQ